MPPQAPEQTKEKPRKRGSDISNTEWLLLILAGAFLDATQWALDGVLVGPLINPAIDLGVGIILPIYFVRQGVNLDWKKGAVWGLTGILEVVSAGIAASWAIDIAFTMILDKLDKRLPL